MNGPFSLTGATAVVFHMINRKDGTIVVNHAATPDADQITNKGRWSYSWLSGDTAVAGDYEGELKVTIGAGVVTFPNTDNKILIRVTPQLAP